MLHTPQVSMLIWTGPAHPVNRLLGLLLSLERQTLTSWEAVIITDGPRPDLEHMLARCVRYLPPAGRIRLHAMPKAVEPHWGYEHRDAGFRLCKGKYLGTTSDDNWYTPGYLAQMTAELNRGAKLVLTDFVHSHQGFGYVRSEPVMGQCDLGCWLADAELVKATPWPGLNFTSDGDFIAALAAKLPGELIAKIRRPLYVHC
jgi:hypothetical protein